jgi:cytoskeletal protein RodZ
MKAVFRFHHRESVEASATGWFALLRRHLVLVIAIKLALLALIFFLFFSAAHRPSPGPDDVSDLLHLPR